MDALPDLGRHLGYDGKAIENQSSERRNKDTDETSDPDAAWGTHQMAGTGADGKPWTEARWVGYGLRLIADTQYEIPVAMHFTPANRWPSVVTTSGPTGASTLPRPRYCERSALASRLGLLDNL